MSEHPSGSSFPGGGHAGGSKSGTAYEGIDLATRPIFGFGIALAAVVLIVAGVLLWQFQLLDTQAASGQAPLHPLAAETEEPPEPRLLADPRAHYDEYLTEQRARLSEPAWLDKDAGTVRVPIERAMELVIEQGFAPR